MLARLPIVNVASPVNWASPLNRGLVGWWLNLPHGQWGGGTLWRDLTRRSHGTLTNGAVWSGAQGRLGGFGSLEFDGADDLVQTTLSGASIGTDNGVNGGRINYSIGCWFRRSTTNVGDILWSCEYAGGDISLILQGGGFLLQAGGNGVGFNQPGFAWTPDQAWHHALVVVLDRTTLPELYLDGVALAGASLSGTANPSASDFVIGGRVQATAGWRGWMDDVRVINRPLAPAEAMAEYMDSLRGRIGTLNWVQRRAWVTEQAAAMSRLLNLRRRYAA